MMAGLHWAVTPSSWCGFGFQKGLTNEEDLIGLWRHQMEFVLHYSFEYTVCLRTYLYALTVYTLTSS